MDLMAFDCFNVVIIFVKIAGSNQTKMNLQTYIFMQAGLSQNKQYMWFPILKFHCPN